MGSRDVHGGKEMRAELGIALAADGGNAQGCPRGCRGLGSPWWQNGAGVGSAMLSPHEMEHVSGVSTCSIAPWPSLQAYVNRFKFQSITADDALGFFLEYFPELKEKGVDSIPGQHHAFLARGLGCHFANQHPMGIGAVLSPLQTSCTLFCLFYWRLLLLASALMEEAHRWPAWDQALTWARACTRSA